MGATSITWVLIASLIIVSPTYAVAPGAIVTPKDLTLNKNPNRNRERDRARSRLLRSGLNRSGLGLGVGNGERGEGSGNGEGEGEGENDGSDSGMNTSVGDGSGKPGAGSSGGSGGSGNKSAKLGYDDNEKKSLESGEAPPKGGDGDHDHKPPGDNGRLSPPPADPSQPMPYWEPMCFFIHPSVSPADANARIKGIVDHFAACKVAIMPFPFTVPDIPESANAAAAMSGTVCPLNKKFGVKYAAAQAHVPWDDFSDELCNSIAPRPPSNDIGKRGTWSKRVGGCAQLDVRGGALSAADETALEGRLKNDGKESHFGGKATPGTPAFSAVDGGQPWTTAVHEVGHNHSMENYKSGLGTGFGLQKLNTFTGGEGPAASFNSEGCAHLVAGANPNTVGARYNPTIKDYYRAIPNSPFRMQGGKSFFGEPPKLSPPPPGNTQPPDGGGSIARNEPPGGNPPPGGAPPQAPPPKDPPAGGGHKKPKAAPSPSGVASLRSGTAGAQVGATPAGKTTTSDTPSDLAGLPPMDGGAVGAGETKAYGYDENGNKQFSGDGVATGNGGQPKIGKGPGFGYDDKGVKTLADGTKVNADGTPFTEPSASGAPAAPDGGRRPASILDDVRSSNASMLDDGFLNRLKLGEKPEPPKARGESLRKPAALQKSLYK